MTDSSFAHQDGYKSTGCCVIFVANNVVVNYSRKQSMVTTSTYESELLEVVRATKEIIYLRGIFEEFGIKFEREALLFTDAKIILENINTDVVRKRSKHYMSKFYFLKQHIGWRVLSVNKIDSKENVADIGTKALSIERFEYLRDKIYNIEERVKHLGWCVSTVTHVKCPTLYNTIETLAETIKTYDAKYENDCE